MCTVIVKKCLCEKEMLSVYECGGEGETGVFYEGIIRGDVIEKSGHFGNFMVISNRCYFFYEFKANITTSRCKL